jgi:hypothetical protein
MQDGGKARVLNIAPMEVGICRVDTVHRYSHLKRKVLFAGSECSKNNTGLEQTKPLCWDQYCVYTVRPICVGAKYM